MIQFIQKCLHLYVQNHTLNINTCYNCSHLEQLQLWTISRATFIHLTVAFNHNLIIAFIIIRVPLMRFYSEIEKSKKS